MYVGILTVTLSTIKTFHSCIYQSVPQPRNSKVGVGKPTLEFLCWTLEFLRWNSNVQRRNSNVGFLISAQIFDKFDDFSMYIVPMNDDKLIEIIKIIKLGKNLGRNEKTHVGIPTLDIGILTSEFQCPTQVFQRGFSNSNLGILRLGNRLVLLSKTQKLYFELGNFFSFIE